MKRILITGSHGYIGTLICPELEQFGYSVNCIDNGYFLNCLVNGSITDLPFTKKHLDRIIIDDIENIDSVIHLAGLQNDPLKSTVPGKVYNIEYEYTKKIAEICKNLGVKFIYVSSCSVYGTGNEGLLNEKSSTNPLTAYSKNKLRIEEYLLSIADISFKPIILRFATVYGFSQRMRFDLYINMFIGMALTEKKIQLNSDGMAWRPNLYIGDISEVFNAVLQSNFSEPSIINIGNPDSNLKVADVVEIIKTIEPGLSTSLLQQEGNSLYGDQYVTNKKDKRSYKVDFSKMKNILGNNICSTNVHQGIEALIKKLKSIHSLNNKINDPNFFRLQWTQKLLDNKIIDQKFKYYR